VVQHKLVHDHHARVLQQRLVNISVRRRVAHLVHDRVVLSGGPPERPPLPHVKTPGDFLVGWFVAFVDEQVEVNGRAAHAGTIQGQQQLLAVVGDA
jgi:hypothetical protein